MRLSYLAKLALSASLFVGVCNSVSAQSSKTSNAKNFSGLSVSSGIDLYIKQGSSESIVVKGNAEILKEIVIEQKGNIVSIKYKEGSSWSRLFKDEDVKAYVTLKTLTSLAASGGSDVTTENAIKAGDVSIASSGGSDLELNLTCNNLKLSTSGGSDVELKGRCQNLSISSSGGSDVDAYSFIAENAKVVASGGSDIQINVTKALDAVASGGGDISYKGSAVLKRPNTSKSGDVTHVN